MLCQERLNDPAYKPFIGKTDLFLLCDINDIYQLSDAS